MSASGRSSREVRDRPDVVACRPPDEGHVALEAVEPALDRTPDVAGSDDEDPPVRQRAAHLHVPLVAVLCPHQVGQPPLCADHQGDCELGRRCVVDAGRVADGHAVGHEREQVVDARRQGLHHAQPRHRGDHLDDPAAEAVRRHVELAAVSPVGPVLGRVGVLDVEGRQHLRMKIELLDGERQEDLHLHDHSRGDFP